MQKKDKEERPQSRKIRTKKYKKQQQHKTKNRIV